MPSGILIADCCRHLTAAAVPIFIMRLILLISFASIRSSYSGSTQLKRLPEYCMTVSGKDVLSNVCCGDIPATACMYMFTSSILELSSVNCDHNFEKISDEQLPPKPNELDKT